MEYVVGLCALLLAVGLTWLGWRLARLLRRTVRQWLTLRRGRGLPLDRLVTGSQVAIMARAAPIDRLTSPRSGRDAIYLQLTEETWDTTPNVLGTAGKWVCTAHLEEAAPFELDDGVHTLAVDPRGAEVLAPVSLGHDRKNGLRYVEALIAPHDEVVVLGQITEQGEFFPDGYRGSSVRQVITAGPDGLTIATPRLLRRRLGLRLGLLGGGALMILTAVAFLLLVASNTMPWTHIRLPGSPKMRQPPPSRHERYWRESTRDARPVGQGQAEAWVLGWITGGRPEMVLEHRLDRELWRHQQNWLQHRGATRHRTWLVFDVVRVEGTVYRRDAFWTTFCNWYPGSCPPR